MRISELARLLSTCFDEEQPAASRSISAVINPGNGLEKKNDVVQEEQNFIKKCRIKRCGNQMQQLAASGRKALKIV
jgi:hypothetical protein